MIDICLLGCGGSMPIPQRYLTSLLLNYKGKKVLVDCGEGTQVSMKMVGWGFKSIDVICFTHCHADHVIGIPGLLLTIANSGRTEPLTIIGPEGFSNIINGLRVVCPYLPFEINIIEAPNNEEFVFSFEGLDIHSLPVDHTTPCLAFSFYIKRSPRFDVEKAKANNIPVILWNRLQKGEVVVHEGTEYAPDMVLGENRRGIKISYFTDTRPIPKLTDFVRDSELLIGEGMYGDNTDLEKALANKHMLFSEAAVIAKQANAAELWLTHFSPVLTDPSQYLENAVSIFENTILGEDRLQKKFDFKGHN